VALCPRGYFAATLANDKNRYDELVVLDPAGRVASRIERHGYDIGFTAVSPEGTKVAAIEYRDGGGVDVRVWDANDGGELWRFLGPTLGSTSAYRFDLTFSADGTRLAATLVTSRREGDGFMTELRAWDAATGRPLLERIGARDEFTSVALSPDGRRIATGQRNSAGVSRIRLWGASGGRPLLTLEGHETPINWLAFSPDGAALASCSGDDSGTGDVRVWDVTTGKRRLTLTGHAHGVSTVSFSADGRRIATTGRALASDGDVKLWDASSGQELLTLRSQSGSVNRVAFTVDGTRLLATGLVSVARRPNPVQVWDATPLAGH
jgi:WD40 repeat protein